jgi:hypothetical protein
MISYFLGTVTVHGFKIRKLKTRSFVANTIRCVVYVLFPSIHSQIEKKPLMSQILSGSEKVALVRNNSVTFSVLMSTDTSFSLANDLNM